MNRKKIILFPILFLLLCIMAVIPALAAETSERVHDQYGLLSTKEKEELENRLRKISDQYDFDFIMLIPQSLGGVGEQEYAQDFMVYNEIGTGSRWGGFCFLQAPAERKAAVVFRDDSREIFTDSVQDKMLEDCLDLLKQDKTFEAYSHIADQTERALARGTQGKSVRPMDLSDMNPAVRFLLVVLGSIAVAAVPTFAIVWTQKSRMKTIRPKDDAGFYIPQDGIHMDIVQDRYIRTALRKEKIVKQSSSSGSSGSSGSGGGGFSGKSGSY